MSHSPAKYVVPSLFTKYSYFPFMYVNAIIVMISLIKLRRKAASAVYRDRGIAAYVTSAELLKKELDAAIRVQCSVLVSEAQCLRQRSTLMTFHRLVFYRISIHNALIAHVSIVWMCLFAL